jgi:hypothetical protein
MYFLAPFALPRARISAVMEQYGKISAEEFTLQTTKLFQSALSLFKRANIATNRNGEAGELILYLMTEWILGAPQLIAKMSLKTNPQMAVHGADGVHVRYCGDTSRLLLYWGESKLYTKVDEAIGAGVKSMTAALDPAKIKHELDLVERNIDFSGLTGDAKAALLRHLDPFDEAYNQRYDIITCLIGFDFDGFDKLAGLDDQNAESRFRELATEKLGVMAKTLPGSLKNGGLQGRPIELFFLPLPSVDQLRSLFQEKIGWKQ